MERIEGKEAVAAPRQWDNYFHEDRRVPLVSGKHTSILASRPRLSSGAGGPALRLACPVEGGCRGCVSSPAFGTHLAH